MSELGQNLKELVLKGIDAIGNTASNIAANTRQKMNMISLQNRRNEILDAFGEKAYEAWKNGTKFPEELETDFREVKALEDELCQMKDTAQCEENAAAPDDASGKTVCPDKQNSEESEELPDNDTRKEDIPVIEVPGSEHTGSKDMPLSDAIDNLFSDPPQMEQMADKINTSLDEMGKQLLNFSAEFGKKLSDLADNMMNNSDGKDE